MNTVEKRASVSAVVRKAYVQKLPKSPEELSGSRSIPSAPTTPSEPTEPFETIEPVEPKKIFESSDIETNETSIECDLFKKSENGPCITSGQVNGVPATILFDGGSEISYVSNYLCEILRTGLQKEPYKAAMANKTTEPLESTVDKIQVSIGPYSEAFRAAAIPLNYDLILGKNGLAITEPK